MNKYINMQKSIIKNFILTFSIFFIYLINFGSTENGFEEGFEFTVNGTGTSFTISNYCNLDESTISTKTADYVNIKFNSPKIYIKSGSDYIEIQGFPSCFSATQAGTIDEKGIYTSIKRITEFNGINGDGEYLLGFSSSYNQESRKYLSQYWKSNYINGINVLCQSPSEAPTQAIKFTRDDTANKASNVIHENVTLSCNIKFEKDGEHKIKITDGSYSSYNPVAGQIEYIQIGTKDSYRIADYGACVTPDGERKNGCEIPYLEGEFNSGNVTTIDNISGLPNLKILDLGKNKIKNIDFLRINNESTNIENLNLKGNQINKINDSTFSKISALKNLDLSENQIETITEGALIGLSNLESLTLEENNISNIPANLFNGFNNLKTLDLKNNKISQLNGCTFCGLIKIKTLDLQNNKISEITSNNNSYPFDNFAINSESSITEPIKIYLSGNLLTEVSTGLKKLIENFSTYLDFGDNYGQRISQGKNLDLYLRNNKIDYVQIEKNNEIANGVNSFKWYGASQNQVTPKYDWYIKSNKDGTNIQSGSGSLTSITNYINNVNLENNFQGILHISLGSAYDELTIGENTSTEPNTFVISFNSNGGSNITSQTVNMGSTATKPSNPSKANYTFIGRYSDSSFNNLYDFNSPVNQNITLYAKREYNGGGSGGGGGGGGTSSTTNTYTLTIYYRYNDGSTASSSYSERIKEGDRYKVYSPYISNYTADYSVVEGTMPSRDKSITVYYSKYKSNYLSVDTTNKYPHTDEWIKLNIETDSDYTGKINFSKFQYKSNSSSSWSNISRTSSTYVSDYSYDWSDGYYKMTRSDYGYATLNKLVKFKKEGYYRIYIADTYGNEKYIQLNVDEDSENNNSSNESDLSLSTNNNNPNTYETIDITLKTDYYIGKIKLYAKFKDSSDSRVKISNSSSTYFSDFSSVWENGYYRMTSSDKGKKTIYDLIKFKKEGSYRIYAEDEEGYSNYITIIVTSNTTNNTKKSDSSGSGSDIDKLISQLFGTNSQNNSQDNGGIEQNIENISDEIYKSRSCKEYKIEYNSTLQAFTSPNLQKIEYFINKDYFKRYIDSKNPHLDNCPYNGEWINTFYNDTSNSTDRYTAPNGKIYFITKNNGQYTSEQLSNTKKFQSINDLKNHIRNHNPFVWMGNY